MTERGGRGGEGEDKGRGDDAAGAGLGAPVVSKLMTLRPASIT